MWKNPSTTLRTAFVLPGVKRRMRKHFMRIYWYLFRNYLVQRILSNWQFDLPIFLIALFPKPRRSHRYACVWEASLSEKYSASNYPKLNFRCTRSKLFVHNFFIKAQTIIFHRKPANPCQCLFDSRQFIFTWLELTPQITTAHFAITRLVDTNQVHF